MNLDNCHGCGSRERPTDLHRPRHDIGIPFCEDCLELDVHYLAYLATQKPHWPQDIHGLPMTLDELLAWGLSTATYRREAA